jgi:hypothetical protein
MTGCVKVCVTENIYEYIDMLGNKGTSNNCYKGVKRGGLYCDIQDGVIQVTQYTLLDKKEVCNE